MLKLFINLCVLFLSISFFSVFSQNNGNLKFNLDSLGIGDSVIIKAKLPSCGEFGQHEEVILIKRSKEGLVASLRKRKPCKTKAEPKTTYDTAFKASYSPIQLSQKEQEIINNFFIQYKNYKIDYSHGIWNASNDFIVRIQNDKIYRIEDMTLRWDEYSPVKNALFNLTDKSYKH